MANVLGELFGNIAGAIREKTGDTATMKPAEFPYKIRAIETGGGSGGGTLPAGAYWEVLGIPCPNQYYQRWFTFQGKLYCLSNTATGNGSVGKCYRWEDGTWVEISIGYMYFRNPYVAPPVEYNGLLHFCGDSKEYHYTFDGTTVTAMNAVPVKIESGGLFVQDGLLKAHSSSNGNIYVWDEQSDSWAVEGVAQNTSTYTFLNVNRVIYAIRNYAGRKYISVYSDGVFGVETEIPADNTWEVWNGIIYALKSQVSRPYAVVQYNPTTQEAKQIGAVPYHHGSGNWFIYGHKLCFVDDNATNTFAAWALHVIE